MGEVFRDLNRDFRLLYSTTGRPSIPPEQLLSAWRLHVFYGVRRERQLMEQLDDKLLYRWFVGLAPGRRGVGRADLYEESRASAARRSVQSLYGDTIASPSGHVMVVRRAFLRRWHADRGRGWPQKLQDEERYRRRRGEFPRLARTTRMNARPIPTAASTARVRGRRADSATWDTPR